MKRMIQNKVQKLLLTINDLASVRILLVSTISRVVCCLLEMHWNVRGNHSKRKAIMVSVCHNILPQWISPYVALCSYSDSEQILRNCVPLILCSSVTHYSFLIFLSYPLLYSFLIVYFQSFFFVCVFLVSKEIYANILNILAFSFYLLTCITAALRLTI